jgi:hypothetical protein
MNFGKLDDLGLEMGLSAIQDQVIPRKHATLGEFGFGPETFVAKWGLRVGLFALGYWLGRISKK